MRFLVAALLLLAALPAVAQTFPTKLVRLVVAFPPGGTNDAIARLLAQRLGEQWPQPVIVDNRPGAGGSIGSDLVARAEPDGHTLLVTPPGPITTNGLLYKSLPYDPQAAFAPITLLSTAPNLLLVNPTLRATTLAALVADAKARPGGFSYASQGTGTTSHLSGAMLARVAGIDLVHVPYKGSAPALNDLLSGQVDMMFDSAGNALGHVASGAVRALAQGGDHRSPRLPEVPTLIESGYPDFVSTVWYALVAPAGTPAPLRAQLAETVGRVLREPEVVQRLAQLGNEPAPTTPEQTATLLAAETARWGGVIRAAGIKPE